MNKSLILAALLIPSLGYSISIDDRKQQLIERMDQITFKATFLQSQIALAPFIVMMGDKDYMESILAEMAEMKKEMKEILAEMESIEKQENYEKSIIS